MTPRVANALRLLGRRRRAIALTLFAAILLFGLAAPVTFAGGGSDVYSNIGPAPQTTTVGLFGRSPIGNYQLDQFFPAIKVGVFSGVDTSGLLPMIAYFIAQVIWLITSFISNVVIALFAFAFSLDLVNGNGTPGSGGLAPVSQAIQNIYHSTFGQPWLIAAVALTSIWAMWKALVQRRYTETAGTLALSLLYCVIALAIVTAPERTIGPASQYANKLSTALLSLTSQGKLASEQSAKQAASDRLFSLLIAQPWTVLEFGGIEHCTKPADGKAKASSVPVRPLGGNPTQEAALSRRLLTSTELKTPSGKTCVNNELKYAPHFLAYAFESKERKQEYEALEHGDNSKLPDSDPAKHDGSYPLGLADEPAAQAAGKGGQYERLLLSILIGIGSFGAWLLLGSLAVGVIVAGVFLLMWLGFSPFALVIGVIPGRGHDFFRGWISRIAGYLLRKVIYSAVLAVVLAVCAALAEATSNLGWLMAFALQAVFLWAVFLQRERIAGDLLAATAGPHSARDGVSRLQTLYYTSRLARMAGLHRHHTNAAAATNTGHGPDAAVPPPPPIQETEPRGADVPEPGEHVNEPIASTEGSGLLGIPRDVLGEDDDARDEPTTTSKAPLPPAGDDHDPGEEPPS
jgi:hypothetical protein